MTKIYSFILTLVLLLTTTFRIHADIPEMFFDIPAAFDSGINEKSTVVLPTPLLPTDSWIIHAETVYKGVPSNDTWGSRLFHAEIVWNDGSTDTNTNHTDLLNFYMRCPIGWPDSYTGDAGRLLERNAALTPVLDIDTDNGTLFTFEIISDGSGVIRAFVKINGSTYQKIYSLNQIAQIDKLVAGSNYDVSGYIRDLKNATPTLYAITDMDFNEVAVGAKKSKSFTTTGGFALTGDITASIGGDDASAFSVAPASVPSIGGAFTVTFSPTVKKIYNATITLNSTGANPVTAKLTGNSDFELPFLTSSEDASDEHWYYLQFARKAQSNLVWSLNDSTRMVVQDTLKGGVARLDQHWKICGNWDYGYWFVNRETGQEIAYNTKSIAGPDGDRRIYTDVPPDGTEGANRYVAVDAGNGDYLEFTRYNKGTTWQIANRTVSYYNSPDRNFICDVGGMYLGNYTINVNNTEMIFIPSDTVFILPLSTNSVQLSANAGETATTTLHVGGATNTTADIAVSITGANEGIFTVTPAILPATGGDLTITFTCPDNSKYYIGYLTLTTPGAQDVVVKVIGVPETLQISTEGNDYWYYIQFVHQPTMAWQRNGDGEEITQEAMIEEEQSQHWKFIDATDGGYLIENRKGGQIAFDNSAGYYAGNAFLSDEGVSVTFRTDNQMQITYHVDNDYGAGYGCLNGSTAGNKVVVYWGGYYGNYLRYLPANGDTFTGIAKPDTGIDSNDMLVSVKYYTLQGIELRQPGATGIYIIKKLYASGKTQSIKVLMHKK